MIRSFIAFDINKKSVLNHFSEVQDILAKTGADLKVIVPRNIHITIRFLGNISADMVDMIYKIMETAFVSPFDVEIHGLGAFPNLGCIRVIWAGIQRGAEELRQVFEQLEPRLRSLGFRSDPKGFNPHLTLARVRTKRNKANLIEYLGILADYEFGVVRADCLKLKKGVLTPRGPIYTTLKESHR